MAIKSVVVHPRGATHIQDLTTRSYFMKKEVVDGTVNWKFWAEPIRGLSTPRWVTDSFANNFEAIGCSQYHMTPIR